MNDAGIDVIVLNLKCIELEDKPLFDLVFAKYSPVISELTFSTIFTWKDSDCDYSGKKSPYTYCYIQDHLFIGFVQDNECYLYPPIGPNTINIMTQLTNVKWISVHSELAKNVITDQYKRLVRDSFDYIYLRQHMIEMNASKMGCFRRHVEQCKRLYDINVRILDTSLIDQCINLNKQWFIDKNFNYDDADYKALMLTLSNYERLGLFGLVFIIDGIVEGFRIGENLNSETHVSHFAKNNTKYKGLGEYMLHSLAKELGPEIIYINLEQDMGNMGMRTHKQKMCPIRMIEKYFYQ